MQQKYFDWSEGGLLVQDAITIIYSFANWSVHHIKRCCNAHAHALAKYAILCEKDVMDLKVVPHCISTAGQYDSLV